MTNIYEILKQCLCVDELQDRSIFTCVHVSSPGGVRIAVGEIVTGGDMSCLWNNASPKLHDPIVVVGIHVTVCVIVVVHSC